MSNSSSYWKGQLDYLQSNPPKRTDFYNKSFEDAISKAENNIGDLVAERDRADAATQQKRDGYNTFYGEMKNYGEVYEQAESEFGVVEHQNNYEKSKKALALAESTLRALPSTINAQSERVLTQRQREQAYNILSDRAVRYRDTLQSQASAYENVWRQARENQAAYAQAEMASQWSKLADFNNAYRMALEEFNTAEQRLTQGRTELQAWQNQYRQWQDMQYNRELEVWNNKLAAALSRYNSAYSGEMYLQQNTPQEYDFGNGYTIKGVNGGEATYWRNGQQISAGKFLMGTASGDNWSTWNKLWDSGLKTEGVGSDTIDWFKKGGSFAPYGYLF